MNTREEQIKLVKKLLKFGVSDDARMVLEKQFPEAAESEDERIRKALIEVFEEKVKDGFEWKAGISNNAVLAWLEKQKEQKPITADMPFNPDVYEVVENGNATGLRRKQKEQKPAVQKRTLKDEAERFLNVLSETPYNNTPITNAQVIVKELITFLESPEKYNPNHISAEWSEEDEEMLDAMVDMVSNSLYEPLCPRNKMLTWLKSLHPQPRWKPSEKQLKSLCVASRSVSSRRDVYNLDTLYNDLKELM